MVLKQSISKEELREYPVHSFDGSITIIDNKKDVDEVCDYLNHQSVLGFDTETRPSFKKGVKYNVALLQLSTNEKAFIFRLNKIGLPKPIIKILENGSIEKSGVAIKDDVLGLQKLAKFKPAGFVELQQKVKNFGINNFSLKKLSAIVLGFSISKNQQTSNWEANQLSEAQIRYAATDAWVSFKIYENLQKITAFDIEETATVIR